MKYVIFSLIFSTSNCFAYGIWPQSVFPPKIKAAQDRCLIGGSPGSRTFGSVGKVGALGKGLYACDDYSSGKRKRLWTIRQN